MTECSSQGVDPRAPRFNQAVTALTLLAAFLLGLPVLLAAPALWLGAAAFLGPRWNLWGQAWVRLVRPALGLAPPTKLKVPGPPRFAAGLGFVFLVPATVLALAGGTAALVGWSLALAVAALAALAAITDYCLGCEIHAGLVRLRALAVRSP
ncbi:MAG TPA: DUF4395 domain-containing protein [Candidatus Thermoplasmatota archaeon]|nr:DUF4395 domain-containing protein [Candidatus Thermoplasmatota archaeon]